jgi:hypothetical protein
MQWVKTNTSPESEFIVLSSANSWFLDKEGEWFPTLAERKSVTTVQGTEWLINSRYNKNKKFYAEIQDCKYKDATCLNNWAEKNQINFSHLYIAKSNCPSGSGNCLDILSSPVLMAQNYQKVFENDDVIIFEKSSKS